MPVHKQKYRSGKVVWCYKFDAPGSTRENRRQIKETGFATKKEAQDAEAARRIDEQKKYEMAKAGVDAPLPKTLARMLDEFFAEYADKKLAPKTVERYREQAAYLARELRDMPLTEITALHLNREWNRLLESGGHHRRTKEARPLSAKTVRNIAGVVSTAFTRAVKWGLVSKNPVEDSEPPVPKKHKAVALAPAHQALLVESASWPWCLGTFLEFSAAIGARRGEVLALRWSDIQDGRARIERSLSQTKQRLEFKGTKGEKVRVVKIPDSVLVALGTHRKRQDEFRQQFGPDYRTDLDLIFAEPDGSPLRPDSVSSAVSALFKRLKIQKPKGAALHLLRHSHGSQLLANGVPLPAVSERLGHSSPYVTATVYSHAIYGQDDEAARKWEEYQQRNRAAANDAQQKGQAQ